MSNSSDDLRSGDWYWLRRDDGSLAPYRFYRLRHDQGLGRVVAEFYVGSLLQGWPLGRIIGPADPPVEDPAVEPPNDLA